MIGHSRRSLLLPVLVVLVTTTILYQLCASSVTRKDAVGIAHVDTKVRNVASTAPVQNNSVIRDGDLEAQLVQPASPNVMSLAPPEELLPQNIHRHASSWPFLSEYLWQDFVDHNRTFLLRPPTTKQDATQLLEWMHRLPRPVVLILQNPGDYPWPPIHINSTDPSLSLDSYQALLEHDKIMRIYVQNPSTIHPKLHPLPLGLKWDYKKHKETVNFYSSIAKSGNEVKQLFLAKANNHKVYVRPSTKRSTKLYPTDNMALKVPRERLCFLLSASAPKSIANCKNATSNNALLSKEDYFQQLLKYQFVTSPAGRGLDCFATWEILLSGGIPIVPRSTLDPMFQDLPVWLVEDWGKEVNDLTLQQKAKQFVEKADSFKWDKLFAKGWFEEIWSAANADEIELLQLPKSLKAKKGRSSTWPHLTHNVFYDVIDKKKIFMVKTPTRESFNQEVLQWLDTSPWQIVLIVKNFDDFPWPPIDEARKGDAETLTETSTYLEILEHANVKRTYVHNPSITHPKLLPIPIGVKRRIYNQTLLDSVARTPKDIKQRFLAKNDPSQSVEHQLYIRPAKSRSSSNYPIFNVALGTPREQLCPMLTENAPISANPSCQDTDTWLSPQNYMEELGRHRFATSPAGYGLDCHATWEILFAGSIPIVPRSTLDPLFEDLPVWLVEDWAEVNDTAVAEKATEFYERADSFNWDKLFVYGWAEEIWEEAYLNT